MCKSYKPDNAFAACGVAPALRRKRQRPSMLPFPSHCVGCSGFVQSPVGAAAEKTPDANRRDRLSLAGRRPFGGAGHWGNRRPLGGKHEADRDDNRVAGRVRRRVRQPRRADRQETGDARRVRDCYPAEDGARGAGAGRRAGGYDRRPRGDARKRAAGGCRPPRGRRRVSSRPAGRQPLGVAVVRAHLPGGYMAKADAGGGPGESVTGAPSQRTASCRCRGWGRRGPSPLSGRSSPGCGRRSQPADLGPVHRPGRDEGDVAAARTAGSTTRPAG